MRHKKARSGVGNANSMNLANAEGCVTAHVVGCSISGVMLSAVAVFVMQWSTMTSSGGLAPRQRNIAEVKWEGDKVVHFVEDCLLC